MKKITLLDTKFIPAFLLFVFLGQISFGQNKTSKSRLEILLENNSEYKRDLPLIEKMRKEGNTDEAIYNFMEARAKKVRTEMLKNFHTTYLVRNKNGEIVNATACHADSMGIISGNSFGSWTGETQCASTNPGSCTPTPWVTTTLPLPGRIDIKTIGPNDPCSDQPGSPIQLPSPYGGSYSIQLGNNFVQAESERLQYSFVVDPSDVNFVYQYAPLLQDPGHLPSEQPFFDFWILDSLNDTIPCSKQHYVAGPGIPGFYSSSLSNPACNMNSYDQVGGPPSTAPVWYKKWTLVGVNLGAYVGQKVTVVCTTADCSRCGHFGYTYLDFTCGAINNQLVCVSDTITTIAAPYDPNFTYLWSTGQTTSSISVNPQLTTTVNVHVTQTISSCGFDLGFVIKQTLMDPGFSFTNICNNYSFTDTTIVNGGLLTGWSWNFGDGSTSSLQNPTHTYTVGGTYTVTLEVTSQAGCKKTSVPTPITIAPPPVIDAGPNTNVCPGGTTTINATATPTGGTYLWSPSSSLSNLNISNPVATPLSATTYNLTYTDLNGCKNYDAVTIGIYVPVALSMGPPLSICTGGSATLGVSNGSNYVWSPPGSLSNPNIANPVATPSVSTVYSLQATDLHGCAISNNQQVTIVVPTVNAGSDKSICMKKTIALSASPAASGNTYQWTPSLGLSDPNIINPIFTSPASGSYTYSVTLTNSIGCTATDAVNITVYTLPSVTAASSGTICTGTSANLYAASSTAISYAWNPSSALSNPNISNPVATPPAVTGSYTYAVVVTDAKGCTNSDTTEISVGVQPEAIADYTFSLTCDGANIIFTDASLNTTAWSWDFGNGSTSSLQNPPPYLVDYNSTSMVTLVVSNTNGACRDTLVTPVTVGQMEGLIQVTPTNVFTPNEDGVNDCFKPIIKGSAVEELAQCITMEIYDRWGIKIFESSGGSDVCWDGKTKSNTKAKDGTYYYIMTLGKSTFKGYVSLLREKGK